MAMVRPIEQRESVLQSNIVERIQQVQQRHPDVQQRHFEMQLSQEHRKRMQQVGQAEEKEAVRFQEEAKREQNGSAKRHSAAPPPAGEEEGEGAGEPSGQEGQGRIDIKI
jgi:hypothetical protein